jgi:hypothetical protein
MTIYTGKNGLVAALGIKLTEVLYVLWIWQWCSILRSQVDTSRLTNLCHPKRTLPVGGELVCAFKRKYASEHQIVHLELPTMHKLLVIVSERLVIPCISGSCLSSSYVDKVDIITPELVLRGFVVCLNTGGGGETMVISGEITS